MPRCKIISHEGNGQYLVELQQDWSILDRKIADLTTIIDTLTPQISTAETVYNGLKAEFDALVDIQELALADLVDANNDPARESERKALTDAVVLATNNAQKKRPEVQTAFEKWQILLVKKQQYQNKKTAYEDNPRENAIVSAQAVDKIDGTVGAFGGNYPLIPIGTFIDIYQLAREANTPNWYIPTALHTEGTGIPVLSLPIQLPLNIRGNIIADDLIDDGAQFWNCAMLPGFQRWEPHIRKGILLSKSGNNFTVRLSPLNNSVGLAMQGIADTFVFDLNYFCGSTAFQVNDLVIVRIDYWTGDTPTGQVIGFAEGPARECDYTGGGEGEYLFSWPKFTLAVGGGDERYGDYIDETLLVTVYEQDGDPEEYGGDYDVRLGSSPFYRYFQYFDLSIISNNNVSLVIRAIDYPVTPDHPGTGDYTYESGAFSATFPRRILTASLPGSPVVHDAGEIKVYSFPGSTVFTREPADIGDPEVPQADREYRRTMHYTIIGTYHTEGGYDILTTVVPSLVSSSVVSDTGSFMASMDTVHGVYTTSYGPNRIISGSGGTRSVEFWCYGDPDVYV